MKRMNSAFRGGYEKLSAGPVAEEDLERPKTEDKHAAEQVPDAVAIPHAQFLHSEERRRRNNVVRTTAKMENPVWYILKAVFIYILVFLDVFLNSSVNSDNYEGLVDGRLTNFWPFLFLIVQTSVQLFIFLTLFLMMCNTYLMRIGLPGVVLADFRALIIVQILYLTLTMVLGIMRIVSYKHVRLHICKYMKKEA